MPHENPTRDEQANALYKALARAGRKHEKQHGWPRNSRGIHAVLTELSLSLLVATLAKNLNKIGYVIVPKKDKNDR